MADGFLGRWSKRKLEAKEGRAVEEPVSEAPPPQQPPQSLRSLSPDGGGSNTAVSSPLPPEAAEPPPTLEDVKSLTPESDFTRFVRADVPADVRNSALKKLFTDPRFNVQDGLDVYIGDYNAPDPIPESMLRQMAGAKLLGLFREEERTDEASAQPPGQPRDDAESQAAPAVAQSGPPADGPVQAPEAVPHDADPDLRLQQDDAAEGGQSGRSPR